GTNGCNLAPHLTGQGLNRPTGQACHVTTFSAYRAIARLAADGVRAGAGRACLSQLCPVPPIERATPSRAAASHPGCLVGGGARPGVFPELPEDRRETGSASP